MSKYGHKPHNWFEAIVNKLGGEERADAFLRDELSVSSPARSWREEDGVIYFSVTSDGTNGEDWIKRLEGNGFRVERKAKLALRSSYFSPTSGVTTEVAVLKGTLFKDNDRITKKIRAEADKRKLSKSNAELACLIRVKFTDEEIEKMSLPGGIVVMHEPTNVSCSDSVLLQLHGDARGSWLYSYEDRPDFMWGCVHGFAFSMSQVSS